ncbi:MAG TPA: hypothetical protein VIP09_14660 [Dehalococcoidia bacterium]|jgi:hypothetical protein
MATHLTLPPVPAHPSRTDVPPPWAKILLNQAAKSLPSGQEGKVTADSPGDGQSVRAAALHCEFEELLCQVLACEREWKLMDRIDLDIRIRAWRGDRETDGQA